MRRITAYGKKTRIAMSLSNYMPKCDKGYTEAYREMKRTINNQPMDVAAICKALNNHRWTTERFEPYRPIDNGFLIKATDPWGNEDLIRITEDED